VNGDILDQHMDATISSARPSAQPSAKEIDSYVKLNGVERKVKQVEDVISEEALLALLWPEIAIG
jgi:hypothetical protein